MSMMQFSSTPSAAQKQRVVDAFCTRFGATPALSNAQKQAFAIQKLDDYARSIVRAVEGEAAERAARTSADANVNGDLGAL